MINKEYKKLFLNWDESMRYSMLSRMKSDCDYYLTYGNRAAHQLWATDEVDQIQYMKILWDSFGYGKTPQWLTWEELREYEQKMCTGPAIVQSCVGEYNLFIRCYDTYELGLIDGSCMLSLLNILEAHGENFEAAIGDCSSYVFSAGAESRTHAVEWLLDNNRFWTTKKEYIDSLCDDSGYTLEQAYVSSKELIMTSDGFVEIDLC